MGTEAGSVAESDIVEEEEQIDPKLVLYLSLEEDYMRVSELIENNSELRAISDDYIKLFEAYKEQYKMGVTLGEKVDELNTILSQNQIQIHNALDEAAKNKAELENLKQDLEFTYRMADASHGREQLAQETILNLRKHISRISAEIELQSKTATEEDESGAAKTKDSVQREKEKLAAEVDHLKILLQTATSFQEDLERKNIAADARINTLSQQMEEEANAKKKLQKEKDEVEETAKAVMEELSRVNQELLATNNKLDDLNMRNKNNEVLVTDLRDTISFMHIEKDKLSEDLETMTTNYEKSKNELKKLGESLKIQGEQLSKSEEDMKTYKKENMMLHRANKTVENTNKTLTDKKRQLEIEQTKLRDTLGLMTREIELYRRKQDADKREIDGLEREREILQKNLKRAETLSFDHIKVIKIQEQSKRKMEAEILNLGKDHLKSQKSLEALEKDKERMIAENLELTRSIKDHVEEINLKHSEMFELKKELIDREGKIRNMHYTYEATRAEKNNFQKLLQDSQNEVSELKSKLKVSSHQCEQLKEDITSKEEQLIKLETQFKKSQTLIEKLSTDIGTETEKYKNAKDEINELKDEIKRLSKTIWDNEIKIKHQNKELEQIMNERDILGSQLVRRNDEISLIYEKIDIYQRTLEIGEQQYAQRIDDIKLLKIEIKRLRQEKNLLTKAILNTTDLQVEVFNLERDLTRERLKCRALEEEVQNPLNIHRWRKLEGSDPDTMELIQKIQILQRRVLAQATELVEKERQLRDMEHLYNRLKTIMEKQPGPQIREELLITQKSLENRGLKFKAVVSELNLCESRASEMKLDMEKLTEQLREFKKKYYDLKKINEGLVQKVKAPKKDKTCQCCGDCPKNAVLDKNGIVTRTEVLFEPPPK